MNAVKTREEIISDFYEKTGAQKLTASEKNQYRPLYDAIENILLVANGQRRNVKAEESNTLSPGLRSLLQSQGLDIQRNANEVEHTTNTGNGAELVPDALFGIDVIDMVPQYTTFMGSLPGYHGNNLGKKETVPILGDEGFMLGNTEWTTGAGAIAQGNSLQPTGEIDIDQVPFIKSVDISKRLLNYATLDLEALIKTRIARSLARTIESCVLNGDAETGATGNVNSDDQAPGTTFGSAYYHHLMTDHGIRELAINGSSLTVNAGTADISDLTSVMNLLGDLASNPDDLLWLFNRRTYNKMLTLDAFYDASKRGASSTLSGNAITNILGSDLFIARDFGLTEADGKLSATASNNTQGGFGLLYKPSVQWGFGQPLEIDVVKIPGKGVQVIGTVEFGFTIVQLKAGMTDSSVGLAINVTV